MKTNLATINMSFSVDASPGREISHAIVGSIEENRYQFSNVYCDDSKALEISDIVCSIESTIAVDTFPYARYFISKDDLERRMNNLQDYKITLVENPYEIRNLRVGGKKFYPKYFSSGSNGRQLLLVNNDGDYHKYNLISDYFQDYCRC